MGFGTLQRRRRALQIGFLVLFLVAPALDWLRFDLHEAQLWFLGGRWSLGIDDFALGKLTATEVAMSIIARGILPAVTLVICFLAVAWRYGRLYCGWLCPHFSLVELLNDLLHRASGRFSVWERDAVVVGDRKPQARYWPLFALSCVTFGIMWAITLLTYLLPPAEIWGGLVNGTLTTNQSRFLLVASVVFSLEFAFARHFFCRFGCAVGFFQSLAWMANPKGMVIAYDAQKTRDCKSCASARSPGGSSCDNACPMRLRPRQVKRMMFSCVQCGRCVSECAESAARRSTMPPLEWRIGVDALRESATRRRDAKMDS
ncbi:MAG: 4Fe-4S binding protein [Burkholderiales bacterium]|nr:4Fe-4S binding protein [Burkholderiales bacterium]